MYYINKMKQHLINWFEYVKEHLLRIISIILIFGICCFLFTLFPRENILNDNSSIVEQHIIIFGITLENWLTALSIIGLIIGAIWAIYQFDKNTNKKQQEKAAKIAKEFSDGLLLKCGIVCVVYKNSPLYNVLNGHKEYDSFKSFTIAELTKIYNYDLPSSYREMEKVCNLDYIYHTVLKNRISTEQTSFNIDINDKKIPKDFSTEELKQIFTFDNSNLPIKFSVLVDDVLNSLESICMDISSQAAGSRYIYQSLHQIFLTTIKTLAIEICLRNNRKIL